MPTRQDGVENRDKVYYMRMLQMNPPLVVFWGSVKCRQTIVFGVRKQWDYGYCYHVICIMKIIIHNNSLRLNFLRSTLTGCISHEG